MFNCLSACSFFHLELSGTLVVTCCQSVVGCLCFHSVTGLPDVARDSASTVLRVSVVDCLCFQGVAGLLDVAHDSASTRLHASAIHRCCHGAEHSRTGCVDYITTLAAMRRQGWICVRLCQCCPLCGQDLSSWEQVSGKDSLKIGNRVDCQRSEKRSKTHKRLQERFVIRRNRTKRANFWVNPLFQATYNNTTENSQTNLSFGRLMPVAVSCPFTLTSFLASNSQKKSLCNCFLLYCCT